MKRGRDSIFFQTGFSAWLILLTGLLFSGVTQAQTGSISGLVKDAKTQETLPGASIWVEGTSSGTTTDFDGRYLLEPLPAGSYNLRISYVSYETVLCKDVQVFAGRNTQLDIALNEATTTISEVTVIAIRRSDTEISVLNALRTHPLVANGLSSRQIALSQDKNASEAIRRIPGITILDNRFVVIRGLNPRYNSVWLNNAPAPSSESDSKAFSFDILPAHVIDNLVIYKSASPQFPADFTGGFVSVTTRNMPDKELYSLSLQGSFRSASTFRKHYRYTGGSLDWIGLDDGTRNLPDYFPTNLQSVSVSDQIELSKRLNDDWNAQLQTALPDSRLLFSMSHRFSLGKTSLGEITALQYNTGQSLTHLINRGYSVYNFAEDHSSLDFDFTDTLFTQTVNLGLLNNWSWFLGKGNKLELRNLFSNQSESSSLFRNGIEYYSNNQIRSFEYGYKNRLTYSTQLSGKHSREQTGTRLDWTLGYSYAGRNEPDIRRIKQIFNDNVTDSRYGLYFLELPTSPLSSNAGRIFMKTQEHLGSGGINYEQDLKLWTMKCVLKSGLFTEIKSRSFSARKLGYVFSDNRNKDVSIQYLDIDELLSASWINSFTGIKLAEETSLSDSYQADNLIIAGYLAVNLALTSRLDLFTGIRIEKNRQTLSSYNRFQQPITVELDTLNFFPSANLTYDLNENSLFRLAYGHSVNRPEFREIAPFPYYDFASNALFSGNPDLKNAYIHNFDLKYEYYPSRGELVSVGLFYKRFLNPIEIRYIETGSGLEYSYHNARSANNYGIEAEVRKSLAQAGWLSHLMVVFNGAWIYSRVDFEEGSVEQDRPLAGQSPYVVNLGLFYSNADKPGLSFSLMYNVIGPRIYIVGQPKTKAWEYIPDIYEMPRHQIDLTLVRQLGKHLEMKVGIKDLLNQPVRFTQSVDTDVDLSQYADTEAGLTHFTRKQVVREYRPGSFFSLGFQYTF